MQSCSHTWGGNDDSARAPKMNILICGLVTAASGVSGAPGGTWRLVRSAEAYRIRVYASVNECEHTPASDRLPSGVNRWLPRVRLLN